MFSLKDSNSYNKNDHGSWITVNTTKLLQPIGSLFQAPRQWGKREMRKRVQKTRGGWEETFYKAPARDYFRVPLLFAPTLLSKSLEQAVNKLPRGWGERRGGAICCCSLSLILCLTSVRSTCTHLTSALQELPAVPLSQR